MDLEKMTVAEIRTLAKEAGIKNVSALKKNELIEAIRNINGSKIPEDNLKESEMPSVNQNEKTGKGKKKTGEAKASSKESKGKTGEAKGSSKEAKEKTGEAKVSSKEAKEKTVEVKPTPEDTSKENGESVFQKEDRKRMPERQNERNREVSTEKNNDRDSANDSKYSTDNLNSEKNRTATATDSRADVSKEIETLEKIAEKYYGRKKEESRQAEISRVSEAGEAEGKNKGTGFRENRTPENGWSESRQGENARNEAKATDHKSGDGRQNSFRQNEYRFYDSKAKDSRQNQQRFDDSRQNQQRFDDNRQNQQRFDDNRQNQQRFDDNRQNQQRVDDNRQYQPKNDNGRQNQPEQNVERRGGMLVYPDESYDLKNVLTPEMAQMDSNETKTGILEVCPEGYGFIRSANFLPGDSDVYVSPAQIRRLNLKTGDFITGNTRIKTAQEKFSALLYVKSVNGRHPSEAVKRPRFEDLTPIFPHERIHLETPGCTPAMRIVDILSPIGKGQRGMIVSQPKAGKTTLLKQIASAIIKNNPEMHVMILLIDERPEEVTDMKESINGDNVEVIYSTFDELPENHKRVSEMVIGRAKRLVEHKKDVVILLDSITRLARAYNLTCTSSGRTLSGGLDPAALHMPKKFFGAARCMREGGSLTILATALVDTGSRMDDVVFEEFKGTGNMELVLDRNLSERRVFPAIDLPRSSTRRDDLLLSSEEMEANEILRHAFNSSKNGEAVEKIINMFAHTKNNAEFIQIVKKTRFV